MVGQGIKRVFRGSRKVSRAIRRIGAAALWDIQRKWISSRYPLRPRVINLLANDICNSRCQMCFIWQRKKDEEFTVEQLGGILKDRYFRIVRHVGVSGGEPTLRKDLPEICGIICRTLPNLKTVSMITNAIRVQEVIDRIIRSDHECRQHHVPLSVMVSLDGVGEVHDLIRGRPGNFASALEVLRHLRDKTSIPLSVGCTITRLNVWNVNPLLDFCRDEGFYIRFRVGEFIHRLYNEKATDVIRAFTDDESYHLAAFFQKLELTYEKSPHVRRTYRSIRAMLSGESGRRIGCPYQARGVVLTCRGDLLFCAPKSAIIGRAVPGSITRTICQSLAELRRIKRQHCSDCIHDYHAPETFAEVLEEYSTQWWYSLIRLKSMVPVAEFITERLLQNRCSRQ